MKYTMNPGSGAFEFEKLKGQEVESIALGEMDTVRFPQVKCSKVTFAHDKYIRVELENGVVVKGKQLVIQTTKQPDTKDIWDLTKEDIGQYMKVVIDGQTYEGEVSDFAEELTYFLDKDTGKIKCEGERNVFVGVQRQYSYAKEL